MDNILCYLYLFLPLSIFYRLCSLIALLWDLFAQSPTKPRMNKASFYLLIQCQVLDPRNKYPKKSEEDLAFSNEEPGSFGKEQIHWLSTTTPNNITNRTFSHLSFLALSTRLESWVVWYLNQTIYSSLLSLRLLQLFCPQQKARRSIPMRMAIASAHSKEGRKNSNLAIQPHRLPYCGRFRFLLALLLLNRKYNGPTLSPVATGIVALLNLPTQFQLIPSLVNNC